MQAWEVADSTGMVLVNVVGTGVGDNSPQPVSGVSSVPYGPGLADVHDDKSSDSPEGGCLNATSFSGDENTIAID
jgi:hypothetical protein